jgi:hypothetical protein
MSLCRAPQEEAVTSERRGTLGTARGHGHAVVRYTTANYMSRPAAQKPFSIRMSSRTLARLDLGARRRGEPKSRTAERLIDEGLRMEDHPGIVFRDGPTGRRAGLAGGPDVWEVVKVLQEFGGDSDEAIASTAECGNLSHAQVNLAVRYYGDFPGEIDERIAFNREETERQYAAWKRTQEAFA